MRKDENGGVPARRFWIRNDSTIVNAPIVGNYRNSEGMGDCGRLFGVQIEPFAPVGRFIVALLKFHAIFAGGGSEGTRIDGSVGDFADAGLGLGEGERFGVLWELGGGVLQVEGVDGFGGGVAGDDLAGGRDLQGQFGGGGRECPGVIACADGWEFGCSGGVGEMGEEEGDDLKLGGTEVAVAFGADDPLKFGGGGMVLAVSGLRVGAEGMPGAELLVGVPALAGSKRV